MSNFDLESFLVGMGASTVLYILALLLTWLAWHNRLKQAKTELIRRRDELNHH